MSIEQESSLKVDGRPMVDAEKLSPAAASRGVSQVVHAQGKFHKTPGNVLVEAPVSLTVNGVLWLSLLCTPVHLEALGLGFLHNEGVIADLAEAAAIRVCPQGDNIDFWLNHPADKPSQWTRTSGCSGGIMGVEPQAGEQNTFTNGGMLSPAQIKNILAEFNQVHFVISRTSPSSRSIAMAESLGITLIGYARRDHCIIYAHAERILTNDEY